MLEARKTLNLMMLASAFTLFSCGTTYDVTEADTGTLSAAQAMFQDAQAAPPPAQVSSTVAMQRFNRVRARIEPVAESLCRRETQSLPDFECDATIGIDRDMKVRNAYFAYGNHMQKKDPMIMFSPSMIVDIQNDDEMAFIMAHEYGHLIGRHHMKRERQALVAAILVTGVAAVAVGSNPSIDPGLISDSVNTGMQIGLYAHSQEYELEADTLGTLIATGAGYDPVQGARFFARGEALKTHQGQLSFWGTHPPDKKRLATVMATEKLIREQGGIVRKASP